MPWTALTHPPDTLGILALALLIEAVTGYPDRLYKALGHPVTWIGALIGTLEHRLNQGTPAARRGKGIAALLLLLALVGTASLVLTAIAAATGHALGLLILALLAASLPAQRSLFVHVRRVAAALRAEGVPGGRRAVSMIVGRNPDSLDEAAICRAAIESLAENFSDGIVAPAFWTGLGGLTGGALYKAINTADSMVGHRTPRFDAYGWAPARLDDLVNLPASRLTALLLIAAAALSRDGSPRGAWRAIRRDARNHRSPNAGWPEAAMAGALGLRLAGPRIYGETRVEDAWMGDGRPDLTPDDIVRALTLYRTACALQFTLVAAGIGIWLALT